MFGKKSSKASTSNINCLISAATRIEGDIHFEGGLRVDGRIKGNLSGDAANVLVVSDQANLEGEVHAANAIINGTIKGTVHVTERLELQPNARIVGDVYYRTMEMHPGSVVEGRLVHQEDNKPVTALPTHRGEAVTAIKQNAAA